MDYKEFSTKKDAQNVVDALNAANGIPIQGNTTLTMCDIEEDGGLFYIRTDAINKNIDLSKSKKDIMLRKELSPDGKISRTKEVKTLKDKLKQ